MIKCPKTLRGMVSALRRKHSKSHVQIRKHYDGYDHDDGVFVTYGFYIEGEDSGILLSWQDLQKLVVKYLNKK